MTQADHIRDAFFNEGRNISEVARDYGVDRKTARKYVAQDDWNAPIPAAETTPLCPKLEPYKAQIDQWLDTDKKAKRKQRHTATRVYNRLCELHGEICDCSYRTVANYVAVRKKEIYKSSSCCLPLLHRAGEAQVDFGEADFYENGVRYGGISAYSGQSDHLFRSFRPGGGA